MLCPAKPIIQPTTIGCMLVYRLQSNHIELYGYIELEIHKIAIVEMRGISVYLAKLFLDIFDFILLLLYY